MNNFYSNWGLTSDTRELMRTFLPVIMLLMLWSIFWKGLALWHAGRRGQPWWFVILLIVNTVGILEIVYLFGVAKLKFSELLSKRPGR